MLARFRKELGIFVLLVILCVAVSLLNPRFLSATNLQNTARLIGMYGIFSLGMGLVIITGGIDLSVGSAFALLGVLLSLMLTDGRFAPAIAVLAIILCGMGLGAIHAFFISRLRLQPFIVTLCGLLFYRGIARFIANDETKGFGEGAGVESLKQIGVGNFFGVPIPFVLLSLLAAFFWMALHRSVYGRHLFALGRNEEAVRYAGINTNRLIASVYIVSGALTGVASLVIAFYSNSVSPPRTVTFSNCMASPPQFWAVAPCAAAKARSSAFCSAPPCFRCCKTLSIYWAFPVP